MTQPSGTGVTNAASGRRADVIYLTQEAHDRLVNELEGLKTEGRERVSRAIGVAREHGTSARTPTTTRPRTSRA
jgi:hypothetical protein